MLVAQSCPTLCDPIRSPALQSDALPSELLIPLIKMGTFSPTVVLVAQTVKHLTAMQETGWGHKESDTTEQLTHITNIRLVTVASSLSCPL